MTFTEIMFGVISLISLIEINSHIDLSGTEKVLFMIGVVCAALALNIIMWRKE